MTSGLLKCTDDISENYPNCDDFEKCIIALRLKSWTYGDIQKKLGMPPKKEISNVLSKWAPELIDNSKKKDIKIAHPEAELYNIIKIKPNQKLSVEIEDDLYTFYIANNKLLFEDWGRADNSFSDLDNRTQQQFLMTVKEKEYQYD